MSDHVVFELVMQKGADDCAIACLSTWLGIPYPTVAAAAPKRRKGGITTQQILRLGKRLGVPLRLQKDFTRDDVGLIDLWRESDQTGHVAFFAKGCVWTTAAGQFWTDLDAYLAHHKWQLLGLIRRA